MAAKEYRDKDGHLIPARFVPVLDRKKDTFAARMAKKATTISEKLSDFKTELLDGVDELYLDMLKEVGVKPSSRKGNVTITTFDKDIKIEVNVKERIEFSDEITIAQDKINEFLAKKTDGVDQELAELVTSAFSTTKGRLDTKRILSLFSLKIKDRLWLEAMELIKRSIQRNSSKRYVQIFQKDERGEYRSIPLDIARV
jgi:hypothetical protein